MALPPTPPILRVVVTRRNEREKRERPRLAKGPLERHCALRAWNSADIQGTAKQQEQTTIMAGGTGTIKEGRRAPSPDPRTTEIKSQGKNQNNRFEQQRGEERGRGERTMERNLKKKKWKHVKPRRHPRGKNKGGWQQPLEPKEPKRPPHRGKRERRQAESMGKREVNKGGNAWERPPTPFPPLFPRHPPTILFWTSEQKGGSATANAAEGA